MQCCSTRIAHVSKLFSLSINTRCICTIYSIVAQSRSSHTEIQAAIVSTRAQFAL